MNADLKKSKKCFLKRSFKLMNNAVILFENVLAIEIRKTQILI